MVVSKQTRIALSISILVGLFAAYTIWSVADSLCYYAGDQAGNYIEAREICHNALRVVSLENGLMLLKPFFVFFAVSYMLVSGIALGITMVRNRAKSVKN